MASPVFNILSFLFIIEKIIKNNLVSASAEEMQMHTGQESRDAVEHN